MKAYAQKQSKPQQQLSHESKRSSAKPAEASHAVHQILYLQRMIGNQAVQRLLAAPMVNIEGESASTNIARVGHDFSRIPLNAKTPVKTQSKLMVNTPGDAHEQEADRIADQVTATPMRSAVSCAPPRIQRFPGQAKERMDAAAPASVDQALAIPGRPLEQALQQDMEQRFGYDFSRVRVHSDTPAEQSARDVNAHAYTVGHDIVFGAGQFSPETQVGRRMIAHELAHVVQQSPNLRRIIPDSVKGESVHDPSEQDTDRVEEHAIGNRAFAAAGRGGASGLLQRDIAPAEVTEVPVQQKPYTRIRETVIDLRRVVQMLSHTPPSYDTAKVVVMSVYKSVEKWLGDLLTSLRLQKVFGTGWTGAFQICWDARNAIGEMYGTIDRAQYDAQLRGETNPQPSLIDVQLAEVEFAVPYIEKLENAVSFELENAEALPDVPTKFTRLSRSEAHVLAWLVKYQAEIASAAAKFKVDRRAVAGAIAWEALVQVKKTSWRAVGPGKPHVWEFSGTSAVDEVEERGNRMPEADDERQEELLKTPSGAAQYIAAIMGDFADTSASHGLEIRNDPGVLATIYHGWRPSEWEEHMKNKAKSHAAGTPWPRPVVANPMGIWVDEHLPYLEEAVGFTSEEQKAIGEKPHGATGEGKTAPVP